MDTFSVLLFVVTSISLLAGALWLMWSAGTSEPMRNYRTGTWTTQVVKRVHPEMADVKPGDELLVVNFSKPIDQQRDPLYEDLQRRIEDPWDEEDDDGDGDVPAILNR